VEGLCVICKNTDEQQARDALRQFHQKIDDVRKNKNLQGELPMVSTAYSIFHGSEGGEYDVVLKKRMSKCTFLKIIVSIVQTHYINSSDKC